MREPWVVKSSLLVVVTIAVTILYSGTYWQHLYLSAGEK